MNNRAKYTDVDAEKQNRIDDIRNMFSDVYDFIENNCKPSRETSLAMTKLEEAQFWAIKGITREEQQNPVTESIQQAVAQIVDKNGNVQF